MYAILNLFTVCRSIEKGSERHHKQIGSMEKERHRGVVKFFRGSFGWLTAATCSDAVGDRDIFLHKNQLNSVPCIYYQTGTLVRILSSFTV